MKFGLLGRTLSHSYSPEIHSYLGSTPYALFEIEPDQVGSFLRQSDFTGINVTMPYKKDVIPYLDSLSVTAKKLGSVNTIIRTPENGLIGHNTDYYGFSYLLDRMTKDVVGQKILVLGSGGASNTVVTVLREKGANPVIISRTGENNYQNLFLHRNATAIINTTPIGMYPNTGTAPVKLSEFPHLNWVLDIVYNPAKTKLLLDAEKLRIPCENGLWMLIAQAKEAAEWFLNIKISDTIIEDIYQKLSVSMRNIILIGMPGCGKSTLAKELSAFTGRRSVDLDKLICETEGCSIPEIFQKGGESAFRSLETNAIASVCKESSLIIATGGGCVTVPDNIPLLRQNGILFWIQRDPQKLPMNGRPLSLSKSPEQLYLERKGLYQACADYIIDNNGEWSRTINQIQQILEDCHENFSIKRT